MTAIKLGPPAALRERLRQLDIERRRIRMLLRLAELEEKERLACRHDLDGRKPAMSGK